MDAQPKILIVDDKPQNLYTLENVLQETGAEIVKANDGEEALHAVLYNDFALILLDVKMPGIDGYELAELLRGRKKTRHIPIIFLSGVYSDDFHVFKGYESGAIDFLVKPINQDILLNKVNIFLELNAQKRQLQEVVAQLEDSNARLNHEVAERQQAEEQLQHYTAELQEANAELSQYAYVVSHDLKAPLRAIRNYAEFLQEDLADKMEAEQQGYFQGLERALHEADTLIDDILVLSRVGRQKMRVETVALGEFLRSVIASLNFPANVEIVMPEEWPHLKTIPMLLRQVFQNLICNAVKFNELPQKRVELGWQALDEDQYDVFVRDNGIGMKPDYQDKIFRVFERLHTREEFEGTGIGLAIVKKAVGKLGGAVRVESQPGAGSTFWVTLPRQQRLQP